MNLIAMIAPVECRCGGQTIIPTFGASEEKPVRGLCPQCGTYMFYPTDLET